MSCRLFLRRPQGERQSIMTVLGRFIEVRDTIRQTSSEDRFGPASSAG